MTDGPSDARSRGARFLLAPGVSIYRAPMDGRTFEYFGEDPFVDRRIAVGYVDGVQSQNASAPARPGRALLVDEDGSPRSAARRSDRGRAPWLSPVRPLSYLRRLVRPEGAT